MTIAEKEQLIDPWDFPLRELMDLARWKRDTRLKRMDDPDTERSIIEADYEAALNRIIAYHGGK